MTEPANPESPTEPPSEGGVETVVVTIQDLAPLQELARSRAAFLSMVSHGLRAPLAAVKGSTARALAERARTTFLGGGGRHAIAGDLPPNLPRSDAVVAPPPPAEKIGSHATGRGRRRAASADEFRRLVAQKRALCNLDVGDVDALRAHQPGRPVVACPGHEQGIPRLPAARRTAARAAWASSKRHEARSLPSVIEAFSVATDTGLTIRSCSKAPPQSRSCFRVTKHDGTTLLLESEWLPRTIYGLARPRAPTPVRAFAGLPGILAESPHFIAKALDRAEQGMEFADALSPVHGGRCSCHAAVAPLGECRFRLRYPSTMAASSGGARRLRVARRRSRRSRPAAGVFAGAVERPVRAPRPAGAPRTAASERGPG